MTCLLAIGYLLHLLNFALCVKGFSRNGRAFKIFTCYSGAVFAIQMATFALWCMSVNNIWLSHFYFWAQFISLSLFYDTLLEGNARRVIRFASPLVLSAIVLQYWIDAELFRSYNLFEISATSGLLVLYSVLHFSQMVGGKPKFRLISTGLVLYLFGSTALFLAGNAINAVAPDVRWTWFSNAALYIVLQLFILTESSLLFSKNKTHANGLPSA